MQGWIKLHRKLIENPIFLKPELLQLFVYCLLKANRKEERIIFNGREEIIKAGQFITGREVLSNELNQKPITTYKRLKLLETLGFLNIKSNNKFSLVTIVNYTFYQESNDGSNSYANNQRTTKEQPDNTNKNDKNIENNNINNNIKDVVVIKDGGNIIDNLIPPTTTNVNMNPEIFYNQNFGLITSYIQQDIQYFIQDGVEEALIIQVMKRAIENNVLRWNYVSKALQNLLKQNIKTLSQYEAHEAQRSRNKNKPPEPIRPKYEICKAPDGWGR